MTITSNGAEAVATATDWYGSTATAEKLGVSGDQLKALRLAGGIPMEGWRKVTEGHRRHYEYDPAIIDKMTLKRTGETEPMAAEAGLADLPVDQVDLEPNTIEALATVGRLGPMEDPAGRARAVLMAAMPNGASYTPGTITHATRVLDSYGLIRRDINGKRTYRIQITNRGRKWLAGHRDLVPHVPDHRAVSGTVRRPEATVDEIKEAVPPMAEPDVTPEPPESAAPAPEPVAVEYVAPDAGEWAETAQDQARQALVAQAEAAARRTLADVEPIDPGAIAAALLRQTVRILSDTDLAAVTAERDALRAHNATLQQHVSSLTARALDAEAGLREVQGVLHNIESQLTPMLTGQDTRLDWLDTRTRTDLLTLLGKVAEWAR